MALLNRSFGLRETVRVFLSVSVFLMVAKYTLGCPMVEEKSAHENASPESTTGSHAAGPGDNAGVKIGPEEARLALIKMIEDKKYDRDALLRGALPYLRKLPIRDVDEDRVSIGTWTCNLKKLKFTSSYISRPEKIFAVFHGRFIRTDKGEWKAEITEFTRGHGKY